jgi:predicted amidohydrolase YtcJ
MKTNWASHYSGDVEILGITAKGILADLVVLGGGYRKAAPNQVAAIPVDMTIVDGKVVYDRAK